MANILIGAVLVAVATGAALPKPAETNAAVARQPDLRYHEPLDRADRFRWAGRMPSELCTFLPEGGRDKGAFLLKTTGQKPNARTFFHGWPQYPKNVYATVRYGAWIRGDAKVECGFMVYNVAGVAMGLSGTFRPFEVKPSDGWKRVTFDYVPPENGYPQVVSRNTPGVFIWGNGEVTIDEITLEYFDDPKRPKAWPGTVEWKRTKPTAAQIAAEKKRQAELDARSAACRGRLGTEPFATDWTAVTLPYAKGEPARWKPAVRCGKDWWYAVPVSEKLAGRIRSIGLETHPLLRDAMFWMWWGGARALTAENCLCAQLARKYPEKPVAFKGMDRVNLRPHERKSDYFTCYYDPKFAADFERIYGGERMFGIWDDEAFVCTSLVFAETLKTFGKPLPKNRDEAFDLFRWCYEATFDAPPERAPFRNLANTSPYLRKYACNVAAGEFNPFIAAVGDKLGGNETGDCMGPNPPKFAIARGTARQWKQMWRNYQTFYQWAYVENRDSGGMRCITDDPALLKPGCRVRRACYLSGPDIAQDYARQKWAYLQPFLSGCGIWTSEDNHSELIQWYDTEEIRTADPMVVALRDPKLYPSEMLKIHEHFYEEIALKRDRGVQVTPFAILTDRAHGYVPMYFATTVWDFFQPTELEQTLPAFLKHVFREYAPNRYYAASAYGDVFDVITNDSDEDLIGSYPVLMPMGDVRFERPFAERLAKAVEKGATLVLNGELLLKYRDAFPADFLGVTVTEEKRTAKESYSRLSGKIIPEKKTFDYRVLKPSTPNSQLSTLNSRLSTLALSLGAHEDPLIVRHRVGKGAVIVTAPDNMKPKGSTTEMITLFDDLLASLSRETLPIRVEAFEKEVENAGEGEKVKVKGEGEKVKVKGEGEELIPAQNVEYAFNRSKTSWIVSFNNANGIRPSTGAYERPLNTDVTKKVTVKVTLPSALGTVEKAIDWWTGAELPLRKGDAGSVLTHEIAGGDCAAIEFVLK